MHAKSKMRNQMWVIAKRQLLLIFSSYLHYSSIAKSTSIVTKVFNGLVHRVRNNWRYLLKLGLYHMISQEVFTGVLVAIFLEN